MFIYLILCTVSVPIPDRGGRVQQGGSRHPSPQHLPGRERPHHAADVQGGAAVQRVQSRRGGRDAKHQHHGTSSFKQRHFAGLQATQDLPQR